ncbi:LuxR C-terminal-related transcriptional regulator [Marinobacteraceae bacterium S3BR75-40.1]
MVAETKLIRPALPAHLVVDKKRLALLDQAQHYAFTLVSAPAGFGKTTLVSHWLERAKPFHVWLTLESRDNHPLLFWEGIWSALEHIDKRFSVCRSTLIQALDGQNETDPVDRLINLLSDYARTWQAPEHLYLVLDDLQLITDQALLSDLRRLVDLAPPLLKIIATSRTAPDLGLSQLLVRNRAQIVSSHMLRFDFPLTCAFLRERLGDRISDQQMKTLHEQTQGWPAALHLATLTEWSADRQSLSAPQGALANYLMEEIYDRLPERLRIFLQEMAALPFFTVEVADAVRGASDSEGLVRQIKEHNLLLQEFGQETQWLRLHDLLRDWLLANATEQARQRGLRRRAADTFSHLGMVTEALELLLADQYFEEAEALLPEALNQWIATGTLPARGEILEQFPIEIRQQSHALGLLEAFLLFFEGRYDKTLQILHRNESLREALPGKVSEDLVAASLLLQCQSARFSGQPQTAQKLIAQAARDVEQSSSRFQGWTYYTLGTDSMMEADLRSAEHYLLRALDTGIRLADIFCAVRSLTPLVAVMIHRCQPRAAQQAYERTWEAFVAMPKRAEEAALLAYLEEMLTLETNDITRADAALQRAFDLDPNALTPMDRIYFHFENWRIGMILNSPARCKSALHDMEKEHQRSGGVWNYMIPSATALDAITRLLDGDSAALIQWSQHTGAGREGPRWRRFHEQALVHRANLIQGTADEEALASFQAELAKGDNQLLQARLDLLNVIGGWYSENDGTAASTSLLAHINRYYPRGCLRLYLDEGPLLIPILEHCLSVAPENRYVSDLLQQFTGGNQIANTSPKPSNENALQEEISRREREVIALLATGFTNQQLGEKLGIAKATIKAHLRSIYSKLGVANRTSAVDRARNLGLIDIE